MSHCFVKSHQCVSYFVRSHLCVSCLVISHQWVSLFCQIPSVRLLSCQISSVTVGVIVLWNSVSMSQCLVSSVDFCVNIYDIFTVYYVWGYLCITSSTLLYMYIMVHCSFIICAISDLNKTNQYLRPQDYHVFKRGFTVYSPLYTHIVLVIEYFIFLSLSLLYNVGLERHWREVSVHQL